ncbi:hypothetical protein HPP92_005335 [Vanilla planifolia]|uniref:AAA+ ATPase domain-containing protein n=1 Tax=Vanilla planifolia TaxID=51239 RepID=A0A835RPY6_VANPL|nr:hypothetical protein HPP92_005653 [Vanilla planifolia]KAG0494341.1 hypothetical protein HPP92_005335 [Vanilla planifolia]
MPSKGKKPLRSSSINRSSPAPSLAYSLQEQQTTRTDEALDRGFLAVAAARFPQLISESAFCGIVSKIEAPHNKGNHARIWLSEEAMLSSSLLPGSLVSVSLAPSGKQGSDGFPLQNFFEDYAVHLEVNIGDSFLNRVGCYFAIASVYPSSEMKKWKNSGRSVLLAGSMEDFYLMETLYTGVLIYGPPGTGKTTLVSCCTRQVGAQLFLVNGPEIFSQYYGESEQALRDIFDSARKAAPAVVFIDELDAIAPSRKNGGEELSLRMVATLLNLMDEIKRFDRIIVIAAKST